MRAACVLLALAVPLAVSADISSEFEAREAVKASILRDFPSMFEDPDLLAAQGGAAEDEEADAENVEAGAPASSISEWDGKGAGVYANRAAARILADSDDFGGDVLAYTGDATGHVRLHGDDLSSSSSSSSSSSRRARPMMTPESLAVLIETSEGMTIGQWFSQQARELQNSIRHLTEKAESIYDSGAEKIRSMGSGIRENVIAIAENVVDTVTVSETQLHAQKARVDSARRALERMMSDVERRMEAEGEKAQADNLRRAASPVNTRDLLVELASGYEDGAVEREVRRRAAAAGGEGHWAWARDVLGGTDVLAEARDSPCSCSTSGPQIGKYRPDAWGSQCYDWDKRGYNWCLVSGGSRCREYPTHKYGNHNAFYRRCGLSVWAARKAEQAQAHVSAAVDVGAKIVDDVVDAGAEMIDDAHETISNFRDDINDRLDNLAGQVASSWNEWQANRAKKEALRALTRESIKYQAMAFAHNTAVVIRQAIAFLRDTAAEAVRDAIPDLVLVGLTGNVNMGVIGREVVYDTSTLQRMEFNYQGAEIGTKAAELIGAGGYVGIGWKGNLENNALSEAYKGGFVSLAASAGPSLGVVSLSVGGLWAVSATDNFVPMPGAVHTVSLTGGASVGAKIPLVDFSAGVGFTTYKAILPGECFQDTDRFVFRMLFDLALPDTLTRIMGAIGAYARAEHHTAVAAQAPNECRSD